MYHFPKDVILASWMAKSPGSCQHCYQRGERERGRERRGQRQRQRDGTLRPAWLGWWLCTHRSCPSFPPSSRFMSAGRGPGPLLAVTPRALRRCHAVLAAMASVLSLSAQSVGRRVLIRAHLLERSLSDPISSDFLLCAFCFTYRELPWACDSDWAGIQWTFRLLFEGWRLPTLPGIVQQGTQWQKLAPRGTDLKS